MGGRELGLLLHELSVPKVRRASFTQSILHYLSHPTMSSGPLLCNLVSLLIFSILIPHLLSLVHLKEPKAPSFIMWGQKAFKLEHELESESPGGLAKIQIPGNPPQCS